MCGGKRPGTGRAAGGLLHVSEAGGVTLVCWWCSPFCRTGNTRWGSRAALIVIALYASFDAGG